MASQTLTTFRNNYLMWWVNVRLFLSALQHQTALCNSFYLLRKSSGGVTSTFVLHPLDLIKIRFQGKMLGITWLSVTCKCIAMLNVILYATSRGVNVKTIAWNKSESKKAYKLEVRTLLLVYLGHIVIYLSKKVNLSWIFPFLMIKKISWTLLSDKKSSPNDGHF